MFVKWGSRRRKGTYNGAILHTAVAVESFRDDAGQPRQRSIGYIASYYEALPREPGREPSGFNDPVGSEAQRRISFWEAALERIAALDISDRDRATLIAGMDRRLPRPTEADFAVSTEHDRLFSEYLDGALEKMRA